MSEELIRKRFTEHGLKIGNYEYYPIGDTTLNQLIKYNVIPNKNYGCYSSRKPDALLTDRRNKHHVKVLAVIEFKQPQCFKTGCDKKDAQEQCNDIAQVLNAPLGICTDGKNNVWINPRHPSEENDYTDPCGEERSYSIIKNENEKPLIDAFRITQESSETNISNLNDDTKKSLELFENVREHISPNNSSMVESYARVDPSSLAKETWRSLWSITKAPPEECLSSFIEIFIFKYLSDLNILDENKSGVDVSFQHVYNRGPSTAYKYYYDNVRDHLKEMFPPDNEDATTIINDFVLDPEVSEHCQVFYKILTMFDDVGELKNIDPSFKSKLFEQFMKQSITKKDWGRYFTPRNIIDAIIKISGIEHLHREAKICDPACGVGGFILEPIKVAREGLHFYYNVEGDEIKSKYYFYGFDKGFKDKEQLTIILAKANMLIFLSELIKQNPSLTKKFAELFNKTFNLLSTSILGTLQKTEKDKYHLIMTNPPYETSGSRNYKEKINNDSQLSDFFETRGFGLESLFLEWAIRSLKPGYKGFIVVPDGILNRLNEKELRKLVRDECIIDGIISLPVNSFYTTPKKTYILAITKKHLESAEARKNQDQTDPVFTYLVSNIGETLDANRFEIEDNDLEEMVSLFNQFKGSKTTFNSQSSRCKIQPINKFKHNNHWSIDRWWTKEEKIDLHIEEEETVLSLEEFKSKMCDTKEKIMKFEQDIEGLI